MTRTLTRSRTQHEQCVDAWLANRADGADDGARVKLLLHGARALWDRARPSLGDVTLAAIFDRALLTARRAYPGLSAVEMQVTDRAAVEVDETAASAELAAALRLMLIEVLEVIDALTADTLTRALHASLAAAKVDEPRRPLHRTLLHARKPEAADS